MSRTLWVLTLFIELLSPCIVIADEPDPKVMKSWVEYYKEIARSYEIGLRSAPNTFLTVVETPVLVYSNPTSGRDTHGAIFIWTRNGRAEVIGDIWSRLTGTTPTTARMVKHSFHSLAIEPLNAKGMDGVVWAPDEPGIVLKPIPEAPAPAQTATGRLTQMRVISKRFNGFDIPAPTSAIVEERERMLRLLPTPIYRYVNDDRLQESADGAVFAFLFDWDPEIILVIEIRPTKEGARWHYGLAHMDNKSLRVEYNGETVWENTERNLGSQRAKYYSVTATTRPNEIK